jgi:pyrroline-5-carboxylate reductase
MLILIAEFFWYFSRMKSIVLFGAGNVATHIFKAFAEIDEYEVIQVYNHQEKSLEFFRNKVPVTTDFTEVFPADIYLLALKDEAIPIAG